MNTREIIEKVRKIENAPKTVKEAAEAVKRTVMGIKRSDVNLYHSIILHDVCMFINCCKENYKEKGGYIGIEIPNAAEIPGSVALGCAIGLMEEFLRIMEVPIYEIKIQDVSNYEYDENDEDEEYVKECKKDAKDSINLWRLLRVRHLVEAVCNSLGINYKD